MDTKPLAEQERLDAIVQSILAPISAGLGVLIAIAAFTERIYIGVPRLQAVFWADVVVALIYGALAVWLWKWPPPHLWAHPVAFLIAVSALGTTLVTSYAQEASEPPLNLALVILGSGLVFLSSRWMLALAGTIWVGWVSVILLLGGRIQQDSIFFLEVATVIALVAHWGRLRAYKQLIEAEAREAAGRQKAEQLAEELGRFASVVAHDLQNPLTAIRLKCGTLRRKAPETIQSTVDALDHVADGMGHMIQDLLDYARAGSGSESRGPVALLSVFEEVQGMFLERFQEEGGTLEASDLPMVIGDRTQLLQLLQNLIGNAFHYRRPDMPPKVVVHGARVPGGVFVTVSDNGRGFDLATREQLFLPFQRGDTGRKGHGLGLATCRRIMESMGGTIEAASQPGGGALFTLWFPNATSTTGN